MGGVRDPKLAGHHSRISTGTATEPFPKKSSDRICLTRRPGDFAKHHVDETAGATGVRASRALRRVESDLRTATLAEPFARMGIVPVMSTSGPRLLRAAGSTTIASARRAVPQDRRRTSHEADRVVDEDPVALTVQADAVPVAEDSAITVKAMEAAASGRLRGVKVRAVDPGATVLRATVPRRAARDINS